VLHPARTEYGPNKLGGLVFGRHHTTVLELRSQAGLFFLTDPRVHHDTWNAWKRPNV
jgi:hypothetical protein